MNNFFTEKVKKLRQNIPTNHGDPLSLVKKLMENRSCELSLNPIYPEEVIEIISSKLVALLTLIPI